MQEMKAEERRLFYELYLHFNYTNDWLIEKYKKLSEEKRRILKERGERLIHEAKCNGVESIDISASVENCEEYCGGAE